MDWEEVKNKIHELDNTWKKALFKIQFSSNRDEINDINSSFSRLRGAVTAKDKTNALIELNEASNHWERIGE